MSACTPVEARWCPVCGVCRASIVAFLAAEAARFEQALAAISTSVLASAACEKQAERLYTQINLLRTLAGQVQRGDDRKATQQA